MLERMDDFFTARVDGYDEHMRLYVEEDSEFYTRRRCFPRQRMQQFLILDAERAWSLRRFLTLIRMQRLRELTLQKLC